MCGRARYAEHAAAKLSQLIGVGKPSHPSNLVKPDPDRESPKDDDNYIGDRSFINHVIENLSPGTEVPVLVRTEAGEYAIVPMKWGLVPAYTRPTDPSHADHYKLFNKRIEAFGDSQRYFDRLASRRRCAVLLDGFFEWTGTPGSKQPYYVHAEHDGQPLIMAGIFEELQCEDGSILRSFAIVTGEPCASFSRLHNRQPVLLSEAQMHLWLEPALSAYDLLQQFRENYKAQQVRFHPVT
ncbi:SOS response-associated peptidase, partial [archaeon]